MKRWLIGLSIVGLFTYSVIYFFESGRVIKADRERYEDCQDNLTTYGCDRFLSDRTSYSQKAWMALMSASGVLLIYSLLNLMRWNQLIRDYLRRSRKNQSIDDPNRDGYWRE